MYERDFKLKYNERFRFSLFFNSFFIFFINYDTRWVQQHQADSLVVVALFINYNTRWEQQHQADSLVVVGAQQQGGGVLSPLL